MRALFSVPIILTVAACESNESKLYGAWERDAARTIENLTENQELDTTKGHFLDAWFGCEMVITYQPDGTGIVSMGRYTLPFPDGSEQTIESSEVAFTFEILDEDDSHVTIKTSSDQELSEPPPSYILNFEDSDTYSVTLDQGPFELKGKEFFKRRRPDKESEQAGDGDA